jgi:predicted nucleic acid-binding protein
MIVADTNILSSFLKVDALDSLRQALHVSQLIVPSAVWLELEAAVTQGHISASEWQTLLNSQSIQPMTLTEAEQAQTEQLPFSLGTGEKEAIVLTKRLSATFFSNDRRALSYCRAQRIPCADLYAVLR